MASANRTNLIIKAADSNSKSVTTTITYVNGSASNAKLLEFAQALNALTTNTLGIVTKETREVLA